MDIVKARFGSNFSEHFEEVFTDIDIAFTGYIDKL